MRVVYKLLMFVLLFNISVLTVASVTGTPRITSVVIDPNQAKTLSSAATNDVLATVMSNIVGFIFTIPVLGSFINLLVNAIYVEDILSKPPFNLGFEVVPGLSFASLIQYVIWIVYAAAVIDMFMKTRMTQD